MLLQTAIGQIESIIGKILKCSSVYETQSWGKTDEPDYLNQVVQLSTLLSPAEVLSKILNIEAEMGRKRYEKWGSRLIDIDILFYNNEIIKQHNLEIPHPELHKRRFTLDPLVEIAPNFVHPVTNKTMLELKNFLTDNLIVKKL